MQTRRRCARFMESGFKSKFTNTPNHPLVLDDDDFQTPIAGVQEKPVILSHTSSKKLRKSPRLVQKDNHLKRHVNQNKKLHKHIRKKLKVTSGETSQAELVTPKNFKRKMKIYKAVKNPRLRNPTPRRFPPFHHRMSPSSMLQAIRCLTKDQKRLVNEMGFGALFHLNIDTLPGKLCEYVVRNYQPTTSAINVQNGQVSISKLKIHDMLGLPFEGININLLEELPGTDPLLVRWNEQFAELRYNSTNYLDLIRDSDIADDIFRLNFIVLFINTFCESNPMGTCNIRLIPKLARVQHIAGLDWCQYLLECLESAKLRWRPDDQHIYYTGPMTLLLLLYVDGVRCDGVRVRRKRPFISAIDTEDLKRIEKYEIKRGGFGQGVVLGDDEGIGIHDEDDSENEELPFLWDNSTIDDFNKKMNIEFKKVIGKKGMIEDAILKGLSRHPENETVRGWFAKMADVFVGLQGHHGGTIVAHQFASDVNDVIPRTPITPPHAGLVASLNQGTNPIESPYSWNPSPRTCDEIDQIVLTTLERIRLRRSIPSFDLGLDLTVEGSVNQDNDGGSQITEVDHHVQSKTMIKGESSDQRNDVQTDQNLILRGKRKVKVSSLLCSPYVSRSVCCAKGVSADEQLIGQSIFASQAEDGLVVWELENGHTMFIMFARTLGPSCKVSSIVIDCWAMFLNKLEEQRSPSSPPRVFFVTHILTEEILDEETDESTRYEQFVSNIFRNLEALPEDNYIMDAHLVFFPLVHDGNYYVIVFDLKNIHINIIDSRKPDSDVHRRYGNRPLVLQRFFCQFLSEIGHAKHARLLKKKLTYFKLKCQTIRNILDHGVYLMRHMECYMGEYQTKWDCGIEEESKGSEAMVLRLRYKYLTKMLLSDYNKKKELITSQAEEFRKFDYDTRKKMMNDTLKMFGVTG